MKVLSPIIYIILWEIYYINCRRPPSYDDKQILIVVSYDGFRKEYLERNVTPNMLEFRDNGVYANHMKGVFPTKTFTNHHSIATGLFPGIHGVTSNKLYDPKFGELRYSYELFHYNPSILPIYILNEINAGTSGCMMWPGSDLKYSNQSCTHIQKYNSTIPLERRVDTIISWLTNEVDPPNLIMFYCEEPDKHTHAFGTESQEVTKYLKKVDNLTKYLQDQLKLNNLDKRTNVIHLSDHGMISVSSPNFINLTKYLINGTYSMYGNSPVLQIVPIEGKEEDYTRLKNGAIENGNFNIYKNDTLLKRWNCNNNPRLGPILAVAELGYAFQDMWEAAKLYNKDYNISLSPESKYGVHGYDNVLPEMFPIFMAKGPLFKEKLIIPPFDTVDLFGLFCKILNIENPPKTNGTLQNVLDLLKYEMPESSGMGAGSIFGIIIVILIAVVLLICAYCYCKKRRHYF